MTGRIVLRAAVFYHPITKYKMTDGRMTADRQKKKEPAECVPAGSL
jgi:hypothetical protein